MSEPVRIRILPPTGPLLPGRGFYQLEEDALYFQVGGFTQPLPFFSYLESESVRYDINRRGHLLFVEVSIPRRRWEVDPTFTEPVGSDQARVVFLDFRQPIRQPKIKTNQTRESIRLEYSSDTGTHTFQLAANLFLAVNNSGHLVAVTMTSLVDDIAGQELTSFRRQNRATA
ncbi:MAG: hypothetical protein P1R58_10050 [bacterium]|nr:hypothetical protein [bacterium]